VSKGVNPVRGPMANDVKREQGNALKIPNNKSWLPTSIATISILFKIFDKVEPCQINKSKVKSQN